jgi:hypothetical protein
LEAQNLVSFIAFKIQITFNFFSVWSPNFSDKLP